MSHMAYATDPRNRLQAIEAEHRTLTQLFDFIGASLQKSRNEGWAFDDYVINLKHLRSVLLDCRFSFDVRFDVGSVYDSVATRTHQIRGCAKICRSKRQRID